MTSETRYFQNDSHTINGLTANKLLTTQSAVATFCGVTPFGQKNGAWGIRVWKRDSGGTETELTSGTPVAQVSRTANGQGIQSNTWDCPETALADTDAIVVRVYYKINAGAWTLCQTWITNQAQNWDSPNQLDSATWTIYYYTWRSYDNKMNTTQIRFYYGDAICNSRIENFTWSEAVVVGYSFSIIPLIRGTGIIDIIKPLSKRLPELTPSVIV